MCCMYKIAIFISLMNVFISFSWFLKNNDNKLKKINLKNSKIIIYVALSYLMKF